MFSATDAADKTHQESEQAEQKRKRDRKPFILVAYIVAFYYISCAPIAVYLFRWTFEEGLADKEPVAFTVVYWMQYLNSTVNPFLYALAEKNFAQRMFHLLRGLSSSNQLRQRHGIADARQQLG